MVMTKARLFLALTIVLAFSQTGALTGSAYDTPPRRETAIFDIAFVTKMPAMKPADDTVGGLSELATYIAQQRDADDNFLFLHGGDSLAPSAMSSFDYGTHMIDLLNVIEPDAFAVNERELAFREDQLSNRIAEASFPFVISNVYDPLTGGNIEGAEDYLCFDVEGYSVCVIAILDPITRDTYLPDRIEIRDGIDTIAKTAERLRADGADSIILMMSHNEGGVRTLIADGIVDLALYTTAREDSITAVGDGLLVKQGTDAGNIADIRVTLQEKDGKVRPTYAAGLRSLADYAKSSEIDDKITYYNTRLEEFIGVVIGESLSPLDTRKTVVRTEETAFGNMLTDALRAHYGADLGVMNSGGIRGNTLYPPGTQITRQILHTELPFRNRSIFLTIKGSDLLQALENSLSLYDEVKGRFPQISGFTLEFCPTNPVGERVMSVVTGDGPLDPLKTYTVATLDYLYKGGDGYQPFGNGMVIQGIKVDNLLIEILTVYIETRGTVTAEVEGRLVKTCY